MLSSTGLEGNDEDVGEGNGKGGLLLVVARLPLRLRFVLLGVILLLLGIMVVLGEESASGVDGRGGLVSRFFPARLFP